MEYPLELFNKIILGKLNPISGLEFKGLNALDELRKLYSEYKKYWLITFSRQANGTYKLISHKSYEFADIFQLPIAEGQDFEDDPTILNKICKIVIKELSLDSMAIKELKYQLVKDQLVLHIEMLKDWRNLTPIKAKYHYFNHLLIKETDRIKVDFSRMVITFTNERALSLFVRNLQAELVLLLDNCLYQVKLKDKHKIYAISKSHTRSDIIKLTFYYLENLLLYLECHFSKYFDFKEQIPYRYRMITVYEMKPRVEVLIGRIRKTVGHKLHEIILEPLEKLINIQGNLTYQQLFYLRNFTIRCLEHFNEQGEELNESNLTSFLEHQNFNSLAFIQYLINAYRKEISKKNTLENRQEFLFGLLKRYRQLPVKGDPYLIDLPCVKKQLDCWINEELSFIFIEDNKR